MALLNFENASNWEEMIVHFVIIIEFLLIKFLVLFFQLESILFLIQENVGSL